MMQVAEAISPRQIRTALFAGTIGAIVEMVPILPIQHLLLGVSPPLVFRSIASGLLGSSAYRSAVGAPILGIALHWLISVGAALVFGTAAVRWPILLRRTVTSGLVFGIGAWAVMTWIVVPLSAAAFPPNRDLGLMAISLLVHMLCFGLPIALATRWFHRREAR